MSVGVDQRVTMSAACKQAQTEGEAWVTWKGERLRLGRIVDSVFDVGGEVVIVNRGRFHVTTLHAKDGYSVDLPSVGKSKREHRSARDTGRKPTRFERWKREIGLSPRSRTLRIQPKQVRALVLERHPASH